MSGKTFEDGKTVPDVVEFPVLADQLVQVLASRHVVANIHQGDDIVVVLFGGLEANGVAGQLLITRVQMNGGAVG